MKTLKDKTKLLVENILGNKLLEANVLLEELIKEAESIREDDISATLNDEAVASDEASSDADETVEEPSSDENEEGEQIDEPTDGDPTLGDNLTDGLTDGLADDTDEENSLGNGELSEMSNDIVEINCEINQKIIGKLYDKISNMKSQLVSLNLNTDEREYISLETKLSYYGNKLEELQSKTNPAIDQTKVEERISIIDKALKTLESEINGSDTEGMGDEIETTPELDNPSGEEPSNDLSGSEEANASSDAETTDETNEDESSDKDGTQENI